MGLFDFFTQNRTPQFTNIVNPGAGPLASLSQNPYALTTLRYPLEVGAAQVPHYVRFDINLPDSSGYLATAGIDTNVESAAQKNAALANSVTDGITFSGASATHIEQRAGVAGAVGGVKSGSTGGDILPAAGGAALTTAATGVLVNQTNITIRPQTTRTKTSIAIYMPETMVTNYSFDWQGRSLTEAMGQYGLFASMGGAIGELAAGAGAAWNDAKKFKFGDAGRDVLNALQGAYNSAKPGATEIISGVGENAGAVGPGFGTFALRGQGKAVNPYTEMVFAAPNPREFTFAFDFHPRSQPEAAQIQQILKTFRMYAAPELAKGYNGRYYIPPAQFDIRFFFQSAENQNIAKISTCALTNIQIDWNGSKPWTTFVDGHPLHITMVLSFKEMDLLFRESIDQFGY